MIIRIKYAIGKPNVIISDAMIRGKTMELSHEPALLNVSN